MIKTSQKPWVKKSGKLYRKRDRKLNKVRYV